MIKYFEKPDNDRVKLLVLYCIEEDDQLNIAASGALAQLSYNNAVICQKIVEVNSFYSVFKEAACSSGIEFQYRIFYILNNISSANKSLCTRLVESCLMEVVFALSRLEVEAEREKVTHLIT